MADTPLHLVSSKRAYFSDDRKVLLRATWRSEGGFVNLSLWRDNVCVETFQLSVGEVPALVSFLVDGLGTVATGDDVAASAS